MNPMNALSNGGLAADPTALNALRYGAGKDGNDKAALKEAAKQLNRSSCASSSRACARPRRSRVSWKARAPTWGTDLLDQQFAVQLSGLPGGLSEAIERQLGKQMQNNAAEKAGLSDALPAASGASTVGRASAGPRQAGFVDQHSEAAATVARESGIPASYMIGQAGHETAGAGARSATPTARRRTTSSASRPPAAGRARSPRSPPPNTSTASRARSRPSSAPTTRMPTRSATTPSSSATARATTR